LLLLLGASWFVGFFNRGHQQIGRVLEPVAKLTHPKMEEVSGLVASAQFENILWAHNDSGNEPRLFAITTDGEVIVPEELQERLYVAEQPKGREKLFEGIAVEEATLVDWESIARNENSLYITEMGNNLNARRHLGIYEVAEPDPHQTSQVTPTRFAEVQYPDQKRFPPFSSWHFDCEAAFCRDGKLYFVTKNRPAFRLFVQQDSANLYSLDLAQLKSVNTLKLVDKIDNLGGWVTAADISPDGRWVALLCESPVQSLWLFETPQQGDRLFTDASSKARLVFQKGGQLESLAFAKYEGQDVLVMINEERELFRITLDEFELVED